MLLALGALLLLVSLFLDWYGPLTAWNAFEVTDVLLAALAIARRLTRRVAQLNELYWQLKYDHGELKARVKAIEAPAPPPALLIASAIGRAARSGSASGCRVRSWRVSSTSGAGSGPGR